MSLVGFSLTRVFVGQMLVYSGIQGVYCEKLVLCIICKSMDAVVGWNFFCTVLSVRSFMTFSLRQGCEREEN